jgi:L-2,4-diaminobutyrate decarboxylase
VHRFDDETERLAEAVVAYALERIRMDPPPLDLGATATELVERAGPTVTPAGLGGVEALRVFAEVLAPACLSVDFPRYLSFVPAAPTDASCLFDLVVGASSIYGGSWLEGSGAVHAENEALAWLARLAGLPATAGGVFVSGGTAGNLSALVAARDTASRARDRARPARWAIAASAEAHSSVVSVARVMDADILVVPGDDRGRLTGDALAAALAAADPAAVDAVFAVVATAGTTNAGVVDDLAGVAAVCQERRLWFHVDGAYGGAALAAPSARHLFDGIEWADSFVVDPHKWLFAPFDCAALIYRRPEDARLAHTQHAAYLDPLTAREEWNPSDYAFHLTRRARGLPFWFSLATHGTDAYRDAVETTLAVTRAGAALVAAASHVELVLEPELSVVLLRRPGWDAEDHAAWSHRVLTEGQAFVVPTSWHGETVSRWCIVNPRTTVDDLALVLDTMR